MPINPRIQVPEANQIIERAVGAGVPEELARYLGKAGGESRLPGDIYGTANYLTASYVGDKQRDEGVDSVSLPETLLDHFPGIVVALVPQEAQREEVMNLWETEEGQKQWLQTVVDRAHAVSAA